MSKSRLPVAFLLMGTMAADLAVAVLFLLPGPHAVLAPDSTTMAVLEAMALSQVALLAIWISIGGRFELAALRLAASAPVLIFWSRLFSHFAPGDQMGLELIVVAWAVIFLAQGTCILTPLLAAQYAGLALEDVDTSVKRDIPFQFSVRTMMTLTAGLAAFFGLMSWFVSYDIFQRLDSAHVLPAVAQGLGHGLIGLAGLWAVLGWGRPAWRLLVLLLVTDAVWTVHAVATFTPAANGQAANFGPMLRFLTVVGVYVALLVGSLWLVRISGLRLRRSPSER